MQFYGNLYLISDIMIDKANRNLVEEYKKMKKSEIIKKVAPCSLMCHTCSAYNDGIICVSAKTLLKYLEGIKEFYEVHMPDSVEAITTLREYLAYILGRSLFRLPQHRT